MILRYLFNGFNPQKTSLFMYLGTFIARRVLIFQVFLFIASYQVVLIVRYNVIYYHAHSCTKVFDYVSFVFACFICWYILIVIQHGTSTKDRTSTTVCLQVGVEANSVFCVLREHHDRFIYVLLFWSCFIKLMIVCINLYFYGRVN